MKFLRNIIPFILLVLMISATNDNKPNVFLIGDSTVRAGREGNGNMGLWGWGSPFYQFFDTSLVNVENHAMGGTSSRTFRSLGLWKPVLERVKKGDYVLMQFGHNDAGAVNDNSRARGTIPGIGDEKEEIDNILTGKHEIVHTYGWYMSQYVKEVKAKGGIPIIMSPIPRNDWNNSMVPRNNEGYGLWAKQVAKKEGAFFIDLNEKMASAMEKLGEEKVTGHLFFKRDHTHTGAAGALLAASLVVEGIKEIKECSLNDYLFQDPNINFPVKIKIYIIGDSTVDNGKDEEEIKGWGRYLAEYMDTSRIIVINKAKAGRSSRSYYYEQRWDSIYQVLEEGDFVLMQFGHNDGGYLDRPKFRGSLKGTGEETKEVIRPDSTLEIVHSYGWYMRKYINDTKEKGAVPIVLSQITRNRWKDGKVERVNENYGKWAKESAKECGAYFVDLNTLIADRYEEMGPDSVKLFFPKDHTHTNEAGARFNAKIISDAFKKYKGCPIRTYAFPLSYYEKKH